MSKSDVLPNVVLFNVTVISTVASTDPAYQVLLVTGSENFVIDQPSIVVSPIDAVVTMNNSYISWRYAQLGAFCPC